MTNFQKLIMNKRIIIGFVLVIILLVVFIMSQRNIERETATKIYNELYRMQRKDRVSKEKQDAYWENLKREGILTKDVQKIIYEMVAEKKQKDFLSK